MSPISTQSRPGVRVLPSDLASQIAAGEVVERPASVAKELLENALDAGASRIELVISGGGIQELTVIDDGAGMSPDDARLSVERHATSKLRTFADLDSLRSYGFRGEALPSIASVSRFELTTREKARDDASVIKMLGGKKAEQRSAGAPVGTKVSVRDLFFNVPARLKFLRATSTESGHVSEVFLSLALSRPDVAFVLVRDGRKVKQFLKVESRKVRASQILERDDLIHVSGERGPLRIEAFLGAADTARNGASGLRFLVNGRPVRDRALAQAVAQAYGPDLERGRYPIGVVYLDLPPHLVDINVHPQKLEVRFAEARAIFDALLSALSKKLGPGSSEGSAEATAPRAALRAARGSRPLRGSRSAHDSPAARPHEPPRDEPSPRSGFERRLREFVSAPSAALELRDSTSAPRARARFIAQIRRSFLLCETRDELVIVDQERLAERVLRARLSSGPSEKKTRTQTLLFPVRVTLTPEATRALSALSADLCEFGIETRSHENNVITIHSLPEPLAHADPASVLAIVSEELLSSSGADHADQLENIAASLARAFCQKRGQILTASEAAALLSGFDELDLQGTSPVLRRIALEDLEALRGPG